MTDNFNELNVVVEKNVTYIRPISKSKYVTLELKKTPARILEVLLENPNSLVSFKSIIDKVWGPNKDMVKGVRQIDVYLRGIKDFIEDCESPYEILRVWNEGFYLKKIK